MNIINKQITKLRDKHQAIVNACNIILEQYPIKQKHDKFSNVMKEINRRKKKHFNQTAAGRKKLSLALKAYWKKRNDNQ